MNPRNVKQLKGNECEDIVLSYLTGQGWNAFTAQHGKGMADLIVYHEDLGCVTYQVKTLTRQGGKHISGNGLVMEGERPRIVLKLTDGRRYYRDNNIDWMVGVDPITHDIYFYPHDVYSKCSTQLTIDKVKPTEHSEAPELQCFKNKREIPNLNEFLD